MIVLQFIGSPVSPSSCAAASMALSFLSLAGFAAFRLPGLVFALFGSLHFAQKFSPFSSVHSCAPPFGHSPGFVAVVAAGLVFAAAFDFADFFVALAGFLVPVYSDIVHSPLAMVRCPQNRLRTDIHEP